MYAWWAGDKSSKNKKIKFKTRRWEIQIGQLKDSYCFSIVKSSKQILIYWFGFFFRMKCTDRELDKYKIYENRFYQLTLSLFTQGKHKSSNKTKCYGTRITYSCSIFHSVSYNVCVCFAVVIVFFFFFSLEYQVAHATSSPGFFLFWFYGHLYGGDYMSKSRKIKT